MVRSAIQVVIRVRPTPNFAGNMIELPPDKKTINICLTKDDIAGHAQSTWMDPPFRFDSVLDNASQETMYEVCGEEITKSVLDGYNGTVMAYGQTGAGKTFTMSGGSTDYKQRGITPRSIQHIFRQISERPEYAFVVRVSYVEIYNESMYDLLSTAEGAPADAGSGDLNIIETANGIAVKGLTHLIATTEQEALNYLFEGETNRQIAAHQLNRNSTRSHCVFTLHVESRSRVESSEKVIRGKLNLVDLAGSERVKKTGSEGTILKEALYINKSLTFLEQVVVALADRNRDHVPYRQSKLTNMLKDSLGGNSKTLLIANVWGQAEHIEETVSAHACSPEDAEPHGASLCEPLRADERLRCRSAHSSSRRG
jgi:kinesin family protein 6/9